MTILFQTSKAEKNAYAAIKEHYPAIFKENLALQLEATYRRNVELLATEMKRRLDYLQETQAVKRSFARDHMLKWIIDSVSFYPRNAVLNTAVLLTRCSHLEIEHRTAPKLIVLRENAFIFELYLAVNTMVA